MLHLILKPMSQAKINYYCREGYYGHMETAATDGLHRYGNDPVLKFFAAFAKIMQGMKH